MELGAIEFWYWWVAGIVFIAVEVFAPGAVFLWLGVAAGVVGVLLWISPELSWEWQFLIFAILAVASVGGWRVFRSRHPEPESDEPGLNRRGRHYIGRTFTLDVPIVNGSGKLKVSDTIWKIEGEDLPKGVQIRVIEVDGTVLKVERA